MACRQSINRCLLALMIIFTEITTNDGWQTFIGNDSSTEPWSTYQNKSFVIPLFQRRQLLSRIDLEKNVIGYKYRIRSSNDEVVQIRKSIQTPNVLSEELYIGKTEVRGDANSFERKSPNGRLTVCSDE